MISSYSTIFALGHAAVKPLLDVPCIVEEKVDGSQFSFQLQPDGTIAMLEKEGCSSGQRKLRWIWMTD